MFFFHSISFNPHDNPVREDIFDLQMGKLVQNPEAII